MLLAEVAMAYALLRGKMSSSSDDGTERDGRTALTADIRGGKERENEPRLSAFWEGGSLTRPLPASGTLTIGRSSSCDVRIDHASVSRKHAEVVRLAEGYLLRDLSSRNGTFINGQRVEEHLLQDGDLLAFGDVQFHFQAPKRPEAPDFEEAEHLSVSQLLSPEPLPLETDYGSMPISDSEMSEGGTEVWRRNTGTQPRG